MFAIIPSVQPERGENSLNQPSKWSNSILQPLSLLLIEFNEDFKFYFGDSYHADGWALSYSPPSPSSSALSANKKVNE